jgi:transposase-like protein
MRPIGSAPELERWRRRAVQLVNGGKHPDDVARLLGCGQCSVYIWLKLQGKAPAEIAAKAHPSRTIAYDRQTN